MLSEQQIDAIRKSLPAVCSHVDAIRATEDFIRAELAGQEPVAWMHWFKYYDGSDVVRVAIGHCPKYNDQDPFRSEPLFAAPVVQPDMVMVPREPTEAMIDAAMNRYQHVSPEAKARYTKMHRENFRCDYKAMIAAAEGK